MIVIVIESFSLLHKHCCYRSGPQFLILHFGKGSKAKPRKKKKKKHALQNYLETTCKFPFQQRSLFQILFHHLETNPCLDSRPATSKIPKLPRTKRFFIHYLNTKCQKMPLTIISFPDFSPAIYNPRFFIQHAFVTHQITFVQHLSAAKALLHRIPGCLEVIPFLASWIADESLKIHAV